MMKIKMKTSAAGPGGNFQEGHVYDVPEQISQKQADSFIHGGFAVLVYIPSKSVTVAETAVFGPSETAVSVPQRKRK